MNCNILFRYSGIRSTKFWKKINSFKGKKHQSLYTKACDLQNLEHEILKDLKVIDKVNDRWLK
jgi:hypothetical protein